MPAALKKFIPVALIFLLAACSGGAGSPELVLGDNPPSSSLTNQAGPVERPPVTVDSGPQGDCSNYARHPEDFKEDEVPELCSEIWQNALKYPLHTYTPPQAELPTRIIPVIEGPALLPREEYIIAPNPVELRDRLREEPFEIQGLP